jgi:hypothetical protein
MQTLFVTMPFHYNLNVELYELYMSVSINLLHYPDAVFFAGVPFHFFRDIFS